MWPVNWVHIFVGTFLNVERSRKSSCVYNFVFFESQNTLRRIRELKKWTGWHKVAYVCSMNLQLTWVRANMSKNMVSTYLCVIACRKRFSFFSSRVFFMVGTINLRPVLFIVHVVFSIFTMSFRYSYIPPKKKLYSRGGYDCGIIINTDRFFFSPSLVNRKYLRLKVCECVYYCLCVRIQSCFETNFVYSSRVKTRR